MLLQSSHYLRHKTKDGSEWWESGVGQIGCEKLSHFSLLSCFWWSENLKQVVHLNVEIEDGSVFGLLYWVLVWILKKRFPPQIKSMCVCAAYKITSRNIGDRSCIINIILDSIRKESHRRECCAIKCVLCVMKNKAEYDIKCSYPPLCPQWRQKIHTYLQQLMQKWGRKWDGRIMFMFGNGGAIFRSGLLHVHHSGKGTFPD